MRGIRVISDSIENGSFYIGSRFAPSICRSVTGEKGRDIIWGKAEEEIELVLGDHVRKILGFRLSVKNVRLVWEGDEDLPPEDDNMVVRRGNYRAIYLHGKEKEAYLSAEKVIANKFRQFCNLESQTEEGSYLVCRKIRLEEWDRIMVNIVVRSLPINHEGDTIPSR